MEKKQVHILRDQKLLNKFCRRRNKDYGCADIFGCQIACPLAHANEIEYQMNIKNLSLGIAYRSFEWQSISHEEGKKIVREKMREAERTLQERQRQHKERVCERKYYPKSSGEEKKE